MDHFLEKNINKLTKINFKKTRKEEIVVSYSNTDKMKKILNWKPKYNNINLILKNVAKWEKNLLNLRKSKYKRDLKNITS